MKPIATNVDRIRQRIEEITLEMHPGDYSDALVNIVYYTLAEAERIGHILGDNRTLIGMVREIESVASLHVPKGRHIN